MSDQLKDDPITIDMVFGTLRVVVTREALNALHDDASGPRDGRELIAANYDTIAQVATMKFEADEAERNDTVRVTDSALEL